jgi:hypothetical protein
MRWRPPSAPAEMRSARVTAHHGAPRGRAPTSMLCYVVLCYVATWQGSHIERLLIGHEILAVPPPNPEALRFDTIDEALEHCEEELLRAARARAAVHAPAAAPAGAGSAAGWRASGRASGSGGGASVRNSLSNRCSLLSSSPLLFSSPLLLSSPLLFSSPLSISSQHLHSSTPLISSHPIPSSLTGAHQPLHDALASGGIGVVRHARAESDRTCANRSHRPELA